MKEDLALIVEVHTSLGDITDEMAKEANESATAFGGLLTVSYPAAAISTAFAVGSFLHGWPAFGGGCTVISLFTLFASRIFWRRTKYYESIVMAYQQRESLRALSSNEWPSLLPDMSEKKKNKRR